MVRRLTWEGRPGQSTTGEVAKRLLGHCLAVQVHLLQDWECKSEYSRTLSVALLGWQPWMSRLPGCCFVEESCEALLSRMAHRNRTHQHLSGFQSALELFVSMPPSSDQPKEQKANVRRDLVHLMEARLLGLITNPQHQHFARTQSVREAVWDDSFPVDFSLPGPPTSVTSQQLLPVLRNALVSLGARGDVPPLLQSTVDQLLPVVTDGEEVSRRHMAYRTLGVWSRERAARRRQAASQRGVAAAVVEATDRATSSTHTQDTRVHECPVPVVAPSAPQPTQDVSSQEDPSLSQASGSLYEPPASDEAVSEGYQSFGDTDSLGSVGGLVEEPDLGHPGLGDEAYFEELCS